MATSICPSRKLALRRDASKGLIEPIVCLASTPHKAPNGIVRANNHARR
jgi:hypothetical protein